MGCNRFCVTHENGYDITEVYLQRDEEYVKRHYGGGNKTGNKTVYISGKITGTTDYYDRFANTERKLYKSGFNVVNPVRKTEHLVSKHEALNLPHPEWSDYMRECMLAIAGCDTIYMLKGWEDSKGARLEHHIAWELGMDIMYEE